MRLGWGPSIVVALPSIQECTVGKGLLLWLLGIPIPVIILLYVFHIV